MSKIKAVIFDMDGVLIDSENIAKEAYFLFMKRFYDADITDDEFESIIGVKTKEQVNFFSEKYGITDSAEEFSRKKNIEFLKRVSEIKAFDGANELLNKLSAEFRLVLATSATGEKFEYESKLLDLDAFDAIITGDDITRGKPDPECFLLAAKKVNSPPEECIVVEDSIAGVRAAKSGRIKCIAIACTFSRQKLIDAGADIVINDVKELSKELIDSLGE